MYKFYFIFLFVFLSCDSIYQNKENDRDKKLKESIDFSQIDSYPQFSNCSELLEKSKEVSCFSKELNTLLDKTLKNNQALLRKMNTDKIDFYMSVNRKGKLQVDSLKYDNQLNTSNNKLVNSISKKISNLFIQPALKRGIPVKVNFKMSVNIEYVED